MKPHFSPSSIPIALIMRENGRSLRFPKTDCDRMIKKLLNSVTAKYRDMSVSRRSLLIIENILKKLSQRGFFARSSSESPEEGGLTLSCQANI